MTRSRNPQPSTLDDFPRPSVAVDVALVTVHEGELKVLLTRRAHEPAAGEWALPGAFLRLDESLEETAARVLSTKAGLEDLFIEQLFTFGAPDRDPRGRVLSVAYYALVDHAKLATTLGDDRCLASVTVAWKGETGGPARAELDSGTVPLPFDHADILGLVVQRLRGKLDYAALGYELLPERFTLRQLQTVHEVILGKALNKDSFRRRMLSSGRIEATGEREQDVLHRPAELYVLKPHLIS